MKIHADLWRAFEQAESSGLGLCCFTEPQRRAIQRRLRGGEVMSPARGVYVRTAQWSSLTYEQKGDCVIKTLAKLHPQWILSGSCAAWLYGVTRTFRLLSQVMVAVPPRSHSYTPAGIVQSYLDDSEKSDLRLRGVRVCSIERTLFDCARTLPLEESLGICDQAVRKRWVSSPRLADFLDEHRGFRGVESARLAFSLIDPLSENGGESKARALMYELGFALPQLQVAFNDPVTHRRYRADFMWTLPNGIQIVGEFDGRQKYVDEGMRNGLTVEQVLEKEKARESRLSIYDVRLLRFGYAELMNPAYFKKLLTEFGVPRR